MIMDIAHTGQFQSQDGNWRNITKEVLEKTISLFKPSDPIPVVIGHPRQDSPAYAWINKLWLEEKNIEGEIKNVLFAETEEDVDPQFLDALKNKKFRKRSASFRPDWSLKHVGVFGGAPVAMKGMGNIQFAESKEDILMDFTEFHSFEEVKMDNQEKGQKTNDQGKTESAQQEQTINFAEAQKLFDETTKRLEQLEKREKELLHTTAVNFAEQNVANGKVLPANKEIIVALYEKLAGDSSEIEFAEGEKSTKKTGVQLLQDFIAKLPRSIEFGEMAQKSNKEEAKLSSFEEMTNAISLNMKGTK